MNHCVHDVRRSPSRPERLFMQFHDGVYRSDDGGASWIDIGTDTALPSDFGFPIVVDPADRAAVAELERAAATHPHYAEALGSLGAGIHVIAQRS